MSYQGWLMYGDRGPIIGKWPTKIVRAPRPLEAGDRVVLDNGMLRRAEGQEVGVYLPMGCRASSNGMGIDVPGWWWWFHFRERLDQPPPAKCCNEAFGECPSREQCADCPK